MRDSEERPSKAEFPPAWPIYQWVSQESVTGFFGKSIELELNRRVLGSARRA